MAYPPAQAANIEQLYTDHHGWLRQWLRRRLGCWHTAEDLAHDTFMRLLRRPVVGSPCEPRAFLGAIAHGLVVDHDRRRELERVYLDTLAQVPQTSEPSPETRLLMIEALARIDALLDGLKPRARSALLLSRLEGLPYPAIAEHLGVSLSTVEKDMAVALRHCYWMRYAV